MSNFSHFVGIDVSKNSLDVYLLPDNKHFTIDNNKQAIKAISKKIPSSAAIVLEATGGYEKLCAETLQSAKHSVCLINPKLVYHFKKSQNQFAKTDKLDSVMLAKFAKERADLRYGLPSKDQRQLIELHRCYNQIKLSIQQESSRMKSAYSPLAQKAHARIIKILTKELDKVETHILEAIQANEERLEVFQRVQTFPGVGKVSAIALVCELPELGQIPKKAIGRLIGVAPMANDSGKYCGKRFIQGGRMPVRNALYMATLVATRHNKYIRAFYQKKLAEGKLKKVALVACMNKIAHILNSMVEHQVDFQYPDACE